MTLSHYRKQRIMLLARLNLGLANEDQEEINLYNHYQKKYIQNKINKSNKSRIL